MSAQDDYQVSALDKLLRPTRNSLGDLTESKQYERGELDNQSSSDPTELPTTTLPTVPKIQSGTVPIYPTLPANGGRFNFGQLNDVGTSSGALANAIVFSAQVPAGRMVYTNKFRCNIEKTDGSISSGIPPTPYTVTLLVNGNAQIYNQQISVQAFDDWYDAMLVAGPLDIIEVSVTGFFGSHSTIEFITHLAGDMLLPNELQTPYTGLRQTAIPVFRVDEK